MEKDLHPVAHEPKNPGISQEPRQPPTLQSRLELKLSHHTTSPLTDQARLCQERWLTW